MLWVIFILSTLHLTMQQECPRPTCMCETQGTKNDIKAECTDLPKVTLPALTSLKVTKDMNTVTNEMLEHVPNLSTLDLSRCSISFINDGTFFNLIRLINLQLSHNRLTYLQPEMFQYMTTLRTLYLDYNLLEELHEDLFVGLANLTVLSLTYNRLYSLPSQLPTSLLELNVSFNQIGPEIGQNSLQLLFKGETLDLYGNPIHTIANWNWIDTTKIKTLRTTLKGVRSSGNITFNQLSSLTLSGSGGTLLDENTLNILKGMTNMDHLTLENFDVSTLVFLESMKTLKSLKLKQIFHINSTCLEKEFSLIQHVHSLDLEESPQLAEILLKHSQGIKFINLEYISFRNCTIREAEINDFSWHNGIGTIDLQDNPLDCTCSNYNWIAKNYNIIKNAEQTLCDSPKDMQNKSVMRICNGTKNERQINGYGSKTVILFEIVLIMSAIHMIAMFTICSYLDRKKCQCVTELQHEILQEEQPEEEEEEEEEEAESTQHPTEC